MEEDAGAMPSESDANTGLFPVTPWSELVRLRGDGEASAAALAHVCRLYWYPVYAYIRSRGVSPHDAEDHTQGFFLRLLERNDLAAVDQTQGKLRNFLLAATKNYLHYMFRQEHAQRRGGGREIVSLDLEWAEGRLRNELADGMNPERAFEQRWTVTLLEHVLKELEEEYARSGRQAVFQALSGFLSWASEPPSYAEVAESLGANEQALRVSVFRLRKRFRNLLHRHIEATVASADEVDAELDYLLRVFSPAS